MTEAKRKKIVYLALIAAIIYGAVNFWPSGKKEAATKYPTIAPLTAQQAVLQKAKPDGLPEFEVAKYDSLHWGGDPFRAEYKQNSTVSPRSRANFDLSGILYSPDYPLAVINRKTVGLGDKINDARVLKIEKTKVILDHNGQELTLTVNRG